MGTETVTTLTAGIVQAAIEAELFHSTAEVVAFIREVRAALLES